MTEEEQLNENLVDFEAVAGAEEKEKGQLIGCYLVSLTPEERIEQKKIVGPSFDDEIWFDI